MPHQKLMFSSLISYTTCSFYQNLFIIKCSSRSSLTVWKGRRAVFKLWRRVTRLALGSLEKSLRRSWSLIFWNSRWESSSGMKARRAALKSAVLSLNNEKNIKLAFFNSKLFKFMDRRYDARTTTFSPEGRLKQVEYAVEAINKTGSSIGILTSHGIILATQKMQTSFLLEESTTSDKIYCIDKHLFCVVSGLSADANYLLEQARVEAQKYRLKYRMPMPIEQLIVVICDMKQQYTQLGGLRPFGAAFLFAGYDKIHGFQLYSTDPSGNYAGWKATAIGTNNQTANSFLKQEYKEGSSLEEGLNLSLKSIVKTMDTAVPNVKKIELMVVSLEGGQVKARNLKQEQIKAALVRNGFEVPN